MEPILPSESSLIHYAVLFDAFILKYIFSFLSAVEVRFVITLVSKRFRDLRVASYEGLQTLVEFAAEKGNLPTLLWLAHTYETFDFYTNIVCQVAAKSGHLHIIEWARANNYEWELANVCRCAAEGGHLAVLKYIRQNVYACSFRDVFVHLCEGGFLDIIRWLEEEVDVKGSLSDYAHAAKHGHIDVLTYGLERNPKEAGKLCELACDFAVSSGQYKTIQFLYNTHGYRALGTQVCKLAARSGKLEALVWARESGHEWDEQTCLEAAYAGHFEIVKWAIANGCKYNIMVCAEAAAMWGDLDMLKWAREFGYEWGSHSRVARLGFMHGHTHVLNYMLEDGVELLEDLLHECANISNKLSSFIWAKEKGYNLPYDMHKFGGDLASLKWVRSHGCEITDMLCKSAAAAGQLDVLRWAKEEGCAFDKSISLAAIDHMGGDHVHILRWAKNNGLLHENIFATALLNNRVQVLKWLKKSGCGVWNWVCEEAMLASEVARRWAINNGFYNTRSTLHLDFNRFFSELSQYQQLQSSM